jgi:hypothetical protein
MGKRAFQKVITGPPARMVYILRRPFYIFSLPAERRMKRKGPQEVP